MKKIEDIQTALMIFEESSNSQAEATENGDYRKGNILYDRIAHAAKFLKEEKQIDKLNRFLDSPFLGVRMWAAYYLLPVNAIESVKILEEIVNTDGIHSLTAQTTLDEWEKGNLEF